MFKAKFEFLALVIQKVLVRQVVKELDLKLIHRVLNLGFSSLKLKYLVYCVYYLYKKRIYLCVNYMKK